MFLGGDATTLVLVIPSTQHNLGTGALDHHFFGEETHIDWGGTTGL